jgi:isopenicillin N synthase-like dioxygenase
VSAQSFPAVPVVDISNPSATSLAALDAACRDHGFFLLTGHGLDAQIEHTWRETERFFDADRAVRQAIARDQANPLGWFDRELTKRKRDQKEVFDFVDPAVPGLDRKNRWPEGLPGFRDSMVQFFDAFSALADRTLALLHRALALSEEGSARIASDRRSSTVRLNHYPLADPVPVGERGGLSELGETALGYHTDPGVLTLLLQDDTGGLQTQSLRDGWIDVPPVRGTVVVNLGDCMQSWTNDRWRAAVHRVVPMTRQRRFSIPYFSNPDRDAVIEPVPELCATRPRYRAVAWRAFIQARTDDNYADLGADDTQMAHYRVEADESA